MKLIRRLQNRYGGVQFQGPDNNITYGRVPRYEEVARILEANDPMAMRFMEPHHHRVRDRESNIRAPAASRLRESQCQSQRVIDDHAVAQLGPVVPRMREAASQGVFVDVEDLTE